MNLAQAKHTKGLRRHSQRMNIKHVVRGGEGRLPPCVHWIVQVGIQQKKFAWTISYQGNTPKG